MYFTLTAARLAGAPMNRQLTLLWLRADPWFLVLFHSSVVGLLNKFCYPWAVSAVEGNSVGESLHGWDGIDDVDGNAATAQRSVRDVEVPK